MMTPYPQFESDAPPPPFVLEGSGSAVIPPFRFRDALAQKIPPSLRAMSGYLLAGIALGLVLVVALSLLSDGGHRKGAAVVTDDVVRLHAKDIGDTCWRGSSNASLAKLSVAIEVGLDGKVRAASATGDSPVMRGCVESHVKRWEFLPQASPSQMVLPFEVDPR